MSVGDYDKLAVHVASTLSIVVVISNHNVNGIVMTSSSKYAELVNQLHLQLDQLIPPCSYHKNFTVTNEEKGKKFIIGGHSASGQAAFEAVQKRLFHFDPVAFFGLDPYQISGETIDEDTPLELPALYWGLTETTCFVDVKKAALGAYKLTAVEAGGRVLYAIRNSQNQMKHCVFTDRGCGVGVFVVCSTKKNIYDWIYESVAMSVQLFVEALLGTRDWSMEHFELPVTKSGQVLLHLNNNTFESDFI
jgi:hypothetical protein